MGFYINGSTQHDYASLAYLPTPPNTDTHFPIPHKSLVDLVTNKVKNIGYTIDEERFGIDSHGDLFGVMTLSREDQNNGTFKNVVGLRNSHCKRFSAALAAGSSVMVCDNLSFSGEIEVGHKHTKNIMDKLPGRIDGMVQDIQTNWIGQAHRFDGYANTALEESDMFEIVGRAIDNEAVLPSNSKMVIDEYRYPSHEEFNRKDGWCLFNAFTEVLKRSPSQQALQDRTIRLHSVFDEFCKDAIEHEVTSYNPLTSEAYDEGLDAADITVAIQQRNSEQRTLSEIPFAGFDY